MFPKELKIDKLKLKKISKIPVKLKNGKTLVGVVYAQEVKPRIARVGWIRVTFLTTGEKVCGLIVEYQDTNRYAKRPLQLLSYNPKRAVRFNKKFFEKLEQIIQKIKQKLKEKGILKEAESRSTSLPVWIQSLGALITVIVGLIAFLIWFKTWYTYKTSEAYANKVEEELNKTLFSKEKHPESIFDEYAEMFAVLSALTRKNSKFYGAIFTGAPGTGKTYMVRWWFYSHGFKYGKDYVILKGSALSREAFIKTLFDYRDKIIILDDFDTGLKDPELVNILKAATDTYPKRVIYSIKTTGKASNQLTIADIPSRFVFNGKIIVITNIPKERIDSALRSRMPVVVFNFPPEKILQILKKGLKLIYTDIPLEVKIQVLDVLSEAVKKFKIRISLRDFKTGLDFYALYGPKEWKERFLALLRERAK